MMDKIFLDTDIILDVLAKRESFYRPAAEVFSLAQTGKLKCFTSPVVVANIHYILTKFKNKNFAKRSLLKIRTFISVLTIKEREIDLALSSNFKDFEDALQYYTALNYDMDFLVTRNKKHYPRKGTPVLDAEEYLIKRSISFP